jgi:hypothetical protein
MSVKVSRKIMQCCYIGLTNFELLSRNSWSTNAASGGLRWQAITGEGWRRLTKWFFLIETDDLASVVSKLERYGGRAQTIDRSH